MRHRSTVFARQRLNFAGRKRAVAVVVNYIIAARQDDSVVSVGTK